MLPVCWLPSSLIADLQEANSFLVCVKLFPSTCACASLASRLFPSISVDMAGNRDLIPALASGLHAQTKHSIYALMVCDVLPQSVLLCHFTVQASRACPALTVASSVKQSPGPNASSLSPSKRLGRQVMAVKPTASQGGPGRPSPPDLNHVQYHYHWTTITSVGLC